MNNEEKNKRVAEFCGWLEVQKYSNSMRPNPNGKHWWGTRDTGSERTYEKIPKYYENLDAMHLAEQSMSPEDRMDYVRKIGFLMDAWATYREFTTTFASAATRFEAFGQTLNLWQPGE